MWTSTENDFSRWKLQWKALCIHLTKLWIWTTRRSGVNSTNDSNTLCSVKQMSRPKCYYTIILWYISLHFSQTILDWNDVFKTKIEQILIKYMSSWWYIFASERFKWYTMSKSNIAWNAYLLQSTIQMNPRQQCKLWFQGNWLIIPFKTGGYLLIMTR